MPAAPDPTRDVEAHLDFRMGPFASEPARWPQAVAQGQHGAGGAVPLTPWIAALDLRDRPHYTALNGFGPLMTWMGDRFVAPVRSPRTNRTVYFGTEFHRLGARVPLLLNPCDAQGWDYPALWPALRDVPVFQYCRLPGQRRQVILTPLDPAYAGPGSPSVPRTGFDSVPFRAKARQVVWRGRASGTRQHPDRIDWAEGLFRACLDDPEAATDVLLADLMSFPRLAAVRALAGKPWADAALTLTAHERVLLAGRSLPPALQRLVRQPLSREQQLRSRYVLCIDGNDIPTGVYWALQSGSLVLRMGTGWETALDFGLRPWEHFVPVAPDGSDLEAVFHQCEADPAMCEAIIANAHRALAWAVDPDLREAIDRAVLARYARNLTVDAP
jgi:hypothetical protein